MNTLVFGIFHGERSRLPMFEFLNSGETTDTGLSLSHKYWNRKVNPARRGFTQSLHTMTEGVAKSIKALNHEEHDGHKCS